MRQQTVFLPHVAFQRLFSRRFSSCNSFIIITLLHSIDIFSPRFDDVTFLQYFYSKRHFCNFLARLTFLRLFVSRDIFPIFCSTWHFCDFFTSLDVSALFYNACGIEVIFFVALSDEALFLSQALTMRFF